MRTRRNSRDTAFFWADKRVIRWFRNTFAKKHYKNLQTVYLALCEMDSDFKEHGDIKQFKTVLSEYSGLSKDTLTRYFYFMEQVELVEAVQIRSEGGTYMTTELFMSEWTDQRYIYTSKQSYFDDILDGAFSIRNYNFPLHKHVSIANLCCAENESAEKEAPVNSKPAAKKTKPILHPKIKGLQQYIKFAKQLRTIVASHITVNKNCSMTTWARSFRTLHKTDGVSVRRIREALTWYADNIGGEYIPQAFSGKSFRDKFIQIESAIERSAQVTHAHKHTPKRGLLAVKSKTDNNIRNTNFNNYDKIGKTDCVQFTDGEGNTVIHTYDDCKRMIEDDAVIDNDVLAEFVGRIKAQEQL